MANYIGNVLTMKVSSNHLAKVLVPAEGLHAGDCVIADTLTKEIEGNYEVYVAKKPSAETVSSGEVAVVLNGGFEEMADGRRPEGQPDYTQYAYKKGDIATVVYADEHLVFEIGKDSVEGASANIEDDVNKYLIQKTGSNKWALSATPATAGKSLKILTTRYFPLGGMFSNNFARTYICLAVEKHA